MNERINELLIEAHKQTNGGIYNGHLSEWTEKFAELIIRECCAITDEVERADLPVVASKFVKAHFGVEE